MAKNFKIADIKAESRYTVATVDKWDGTAKAEEMTGAQLVAFANAAAHLYDIHAEEIAEPAQAAEKLENARQALEARNDRSAWDKGVTAYALELLEELAEAVRVGYITAEDLSTPAGRRAAMLNGAADWSAYSWGGSALIYNGDIAERLCTPSELKRTRGGERRPNSREEWLDTQARALYQAANRAARAIKEG